jgi:hypothetical protein
MQRHRRGVDAMPPLLPPFKLQFEYYYDHDRNLSCQMADRAHAGRIRADDDKINIQLLLFFIANRPLLIGKIF